MLNPQATQLTTQLFGVALNLSKLWERQGFTLSSTFVDPWAEYRSAEKLRLESLTPEQKIANTQSHRIGVVDDCYRCVDCEIGKWNAWKSHC